MASIKPLLSLGTSKPVSTRFKSSRKVLPALLRHYNGQTGLPPKPGLWFKVLVLSLLALLVVPGLPYGLSTIPVAKAAPVLNLVKSQDGDPVLGGTIKYSLTISNTGTPPTAFNLSLQDVLPPNVTFVAGSTTPVALGDPTVTTAGSVQTLNWVNFKDLAANEKYTITFQGKLDPSITVNTNLTNIATVTASNDPRSTVANYTASSSSSGVALPFKLTKKTLQSTGVNQDTGACPSSTGAGRTYQYELDVQNNFVGASQNGVVTDTLPNGVEYCNTMTTGPAPTTVTRNADGTTTLVWNLGTLAQSSLTILKPDVIIAYRYLHGTGTIIPDNTVFTNTSTMTGNYLGNPYTSGPATSKVTGRYATIAKSVDTLSVGYNDTLLYTLTPSTSSNYNASNEYLVDTIPDGQDFVNGSTSLPLSDIPVTIYTPCAGGTHPSTGVYLCPDGTTVITFGPFNNSASTPMTAGTQYNVTFQAKIRTTYRSNSQPVLAGDEFLNNVSLTFDAASIAGLPANSVNLHTEQASAGESIITYNLNKNILAVTKNDGSTPPANEGGVLGTNSVTNGGAGSRTANRTAQAAVGDIVTFQLEFNGAGTADMRNIVLTDFLPANYTYVAGSVTYNNTGPYPVGYQAYTGGVTSNLTSSPLTWTLTGNAGDNITPIGSVFRVQFKAQVTGASGTANDNLGKVSGQNTPGAAVSDRDKVTVNLITPNLTITKTNNAANPASGSANFQYQVIIKNTGANTAYQVANLIDTLPVDIKYVSMSSIALSSGVNPPGVTTPPTYTPLASGYGGTLTFTGVSNIPPNGQITIVYNAQIDPAPLSGQNEVNTARIASYQSQASGTPSATYGPTQGTSTVRIVGQTMSKSAAIVTPQVNGTGGAPTIGDSVTYTIIYSIPNNVTTNGGYIAECLPLGFHYVANSYTGTVTNGTIPGFNSPNLENSGNFTTAATAPSTSVCRTDQQFLRINLPNFSNTSGSAIGLQIQLTALITGKNNAGTLVFNTYPGANSTNSAAANNTNKAYFFNNNTQTASATSGAIKGTGTGTGDNSVFIPHLTLNKTRVRPASPTAGGVAVDFLLTLTNDGGSPAYQIANLVDTFDPVFTSLTAYSSDNTCQTTTQVPGVTLTGQTLTIPVTVASLAPGAAYYVCVEGTLPSSVSPSTTYNNSIILGAGQGNGTQYNSAPSTYPGQSYSNVSGASANITTLPASVNKTEVSGRPSSNGQAVPGETVTFQLNFTIPAGTTLYSPVLTDTLDTTRLGVPADTTSGAGTLTCTNGAAGPYTFSYTGGVINYTFSGNLTAGAAASVCTVQFDSQVLNVAANNAGTAAISNNFILGFKNNTGTAVTPLTSNNATVTPREPNVTIGKTVLTPYDAATGQITFQVVITNSASPATTAYNLNVADTLPTGLSYVSSSSATVTPGGGAVNPAVDGSGTLTADSLAPGASISYTITARGNGTLGVGTSQTNLASLTYYDLPSTINSSTAVPGVSTARRGYTGNGSVGFTLPTVTFNKTPANQTIVISGTVNYTLNVVVPAGTALYQVTVDDTLPSGLVLQNNGLTYDSVSPGVCAAPSNAPIAASNSSLNLGTLANATGGVCTYTIGVAARSDGSVPAVGDNSALVVNTGNLSYSTTPTGTIVSTTATANTTINAPVLTFTKLNSPTGQVDTGSTIHYSLVYTNTGAAPATGVVITDNVPGTTTVVVSSITGGGTASSGGSSPGGTITWNIGTIAAGASGTVGFDVVVNSIPSNGSINNNASLVSNERPTLTDTVNNSATNLQAVKSVNPSTSSSVNPGDTLTYSIAVSNPLPATANATGVVITDTVPLNTTFSSAGQGGTLSAGTVTWNVGTLAPGDTQTVTFQVTVDEPLDNGTVIPNFGYYSSNQLQPPAPTNTVTNTVQSAPTLALVKGEEPAQPGPLGVDGLVTYTLTLSNTGNEDASNAIISDTVPTGSVFVSASTPGSYDSTTGAVSWNVGTVEAPEGSATVTFTVSLPADPATGQVTADLTLSNTAHYSYSNAPGGGPAGPGVNSGSGDSNTVTENTLGQSLSKTNNPTFATPVQPGDTITYTLTYANTGTAAIQNVVVSDTLPVYTNFSSADTGGTYSAVDNTVTWNVGTVNAGQNVTLQYSVVLTAPLASGTLIPNVATASAGSNGGAGGTGGSGAASGIVPPVISNVVTNTVNSSPVFDIVKSNSPQTPVKAGDVIHYELVVINNGNANATSVVVNDQIPAGTTFIAGSATGGTSFSFSGGVASWMIDSLPVGVTETLGFSVVVNNPLPTPPVDIVNTAEVVGSTETGPLSDPGRSNTVTNPTVGIKITKSDNPGDGVGVKYGGTIQYTLNYTNLGTLPLSEVVVRDSVPGGTTYVSGSGGNFAAGGDNGRGVVSWNIGTLAAGQTGAVSFSVVVDDPTSPEELTVVNTAQIEANEVNNGDPTDSNTVTNPTSANPPPVTPTPPPTSPVPTTTPQPGSTPTPTVTPVETPTPTPSPSGTPGPSETPSGTPVPTTGVSVTPVPTSTAPSNVGGGGTEPGLPNTGMAPISTSGLGDILSTPASNQNLALSMLAWALLLALFWWLRYQISVGSAGGSTNRKKTLGRLNLLAVVSLVLALGLQVGIRPVTSFAQVAPVTPGSDTQHFTVQRGVSDIDMFGRNLLNTYSVPASTANLKPGSGAVMPYRIRIPILGIDSHIESVGLYKGAMDVPSNIWDTAWLSSGPRPGEAGNAVIDGHKDSVAGVAVFWRLGELKPGDKIYVSDRDGWELTFEVSQVASYVTAQAPLAQVFGPSTDHNLNLITCDGSFDAGRHTYDKRLVVYTHQVTSN